MCSAVQNAGVEAKAVIHWMSEILLATKVALRGLHRGMPQQKLNLLELSAIAVTQLRAGAAQVVWSNVLQLCTLAAGPNHIPDDVL